MAVFRIGDKVSYHMNENREQFVTDLKRGTKMYGWQRGENVEDTIENFALANPHATLGQFIDWTKKTGMIRLQAIKAGKALPTYGMELMDIAKRAHEASKGGAVPQSTSQSRQGVTMVDSVPARLKSSTQAKKIAEPGNEPDDLDNDGDKQDAVIGEQKDGPGTPDYKALQNLPATDPNAGKPDPVDPPYVAQPASAGNPFAERLQKMAEGKS